MKRVHTHYDNLRISRSAPPEVIKAAYKALSQKYHPDKNPDEVDAVRIMAAVNKAYEVLSDPVRRQLHDEWIARAEGVLPVEDQQAAPRQQRPRPRQQGFGIRLLLALRDAILEIAVRLFGIVAGFGAIIGAIWLITQGVERLPSGSSPSDRPETFSSKPIYERPLTAPNGEPWPSDASYVPGYPILNRDGLSSLTIDNTANESDVFVKILYLGGSKAVKVRHFYIPSGARFRAAKLRAGSYDVRYRDLSNGAMAKSETFKLEEHETSNATSFSEVTITLYTVTNGNLDMRPISADEF